MLYPVLLSYMMLTLKRASQVSLSLKQVSFSSPGFQV